MLKQKGFTIVELLVVIIAIGILAAVTIVAYNGVQDRARVSRKQLDMSSIAKAAAAADVVSTSPVNLNDTLTSAQIDAALSTLGLTAMKGSIVVDSTNPVSGNDCRQSPMTKDKYCMSVTGPGFEIVYWHDQQKKWKLRIGSVGSYTETDIGTGTYPDAQVY